MLFLVLLKVVLIWVFIYLVVVVSGEIFLVLVKFLFDVKGDGMSYLKIWFDE